MNLPEYRLVQYDPESGYEVLAILPSVWECVKEWELFAAGDLVGDYRIEDGDYNPVWRNVPAKRREEMGA